MLASAKDQIAEKSFIKNPEDRLPSLQDKLKSVDNQLQNSAYKAAYNKLTNDVRPRVEEWLHDDAAVPANYYTKSELLELIDDVIARLKALYDVYDDLPGCGPPDDHPGQGPPDDHPGRGPLEDTPGRDPPDEPLAVTRQTTIRPAVAHRMTTMTRGGNHRTMTTTVETAVIVQGPARSSQFRSDEALLGSFPVGITQMRTI